jgi:hypothetical protein
MLNGQNERVCLVDVLKTPPYLLDLCIFVLFGSFSKELRALFDQFTTIFFEQEQDSFCRSLSSIRKYYLNSWSTMCLSMLGRLVNSRSYSDHDVNCNYMQDAS